MDLRRSSTSSSNNNNNNNKNSLEFRSTFPKVTYRKTLRCHGSNLPNFLQLIYNSFIMFNRLLLTTSKYLPSFFIWSLFVHFNISL
jgi:hypothetical protein